MKKTQANLFLQRLEDICFAINTNIPMINHGGCCVFASYMGKKLQELGIPARIRTINSVIVDEEIEDESVRYLNLDEIKDKLIRNSVNEWYKNGVDLYHVLVEFDLNGHSYLCDSTGLDPYMDPEDDSIFLCDGSMPVEWAEELASVQDGWNCWFNRNNIPEMRAIIDFRFIKLERLYRGLDKH